MNKKWVVGQWYHLNAARRAQHSSNNGYIPVTKFWKTLGLTFDVCPIFRVCGVDSNDNSVKLIQIPTAYGSFHSQSVNIDKKWLDYVHPFVPSTDIVIADDISKLLREDVYYYGNSATIDVLLQLGTMKNTYNLTSLRCFLNGETKCQSTANVISFKLIENYGVVRSCVIFGYHQRAGIKPGVRKFNDQILPWWIGLVLYKATCEDIPDNELSTEKQKIQEATEEMLTALPSRHLVSA